MQGNLYPSVSVSASEAPLYHAAGFAMLRAPLLPIQSYPHSQGMMDDDPLFRQPIVRLALIVGSNSLYQAIDRIPASPKKRAKVAESLMRFHIRMSSRPTPFGLFAGVALVEFGPCTDLTIGHPHTSIRPDMAWLLTILGRLEVQNDVFSWLRFRSNNATLFRAGRVYLCDRTSREDLAASAEVSVKATPAVQMVLAAAREPLTYHELAGKLLLCPGATPQRVEKLIRDLVDQSFLLPDIRPPVTTNAPIDYVLDRLANIPGAETVGSKLREVSQEANMIRPEDPVAVDNYRALVTKAHELAGDSSPPFQVDMILSLSGCRLSHHVGEEAARAGELLLRITPFPLGLPQMTAYRQSFETRYGIGREVPLLELLDPHIGLGPLGGLAGGRAGGSTPALEARRNRRLLALACGALRDRRITITLGEKELADLQTWEPKAESVPTSMELYCFVEAASQEAVDAGQFRLVLGPNLGAIPAGKTFGRFANSLGADALAHLRGLCRSEECFAPEAVFAEVVYVPRRFRSTNVVVRPSLWEYEIAFGVTPGVENNRVIPVDELVVGVRAGRFYVRWTKSGVEVIPRASHMLTTADAPAPIEFLTEVWRDGLAQLSVFDWGPAVGFPFLPRVEVGRTILRPAEWRLTHGEDGIDPTSGPGHNY